MAHGYFHFLSTRHKLEVTVEDRYQRQPESERFADTFARYFLMPSAGLMRRFTDAKQHSKVTPALLCTWANYYGVSTQAITLRFESMRLLPSGTWDKIKASLKVRELQRELGLEDIPSRANKHPMRYSYLAIDAFRTEQITEGELARFLEVDRIETRHLREEGLLENPVSAADESGHQSPPDLAQE